MRCCELETWSEGVDGTVYLPYFKKKNCQGLSKHFSSSLYVFLHAISTYVKHCCLTETGTSMFSWTGNHWRVVSDSVVGSRQRKDTCLPYCRCMDEWSKNLVLKCQMALPKMAFVLAHFQQNAQGAGEFYKYSCIVICLFTVTDTSKSFSLSLREKNQTPNQLIGNLLNVLPA